MSATVSVVALHPNASETNPTTSGRGAFQFLRHGSDAEDVTVKYSVKSTSTASTADYNALKGKIIIHAGSRSALLYINPVNDSKHESAEKLTIAVSARPVYKVVGTTATITIADNDPVTPPPHTSDWAVTDRHYRVPITIAAGSDARSNQPVDHDINFTTALTALNKSGSLVTNSIKVVEVSADGKTVIDSNVPYQFDQASGYNAASNASGDLVILTKGTTAASASRHYQVYFDTTGSFTTPSFTALVSTDANTTDQGMNAVKITTQTATYWLQKANGGFSSIEDTSGNDWLSFDPTSGTGSAGEFRGTPNSVYPGGGFHAGFIDGSTVVVSSGPLKTVLESTVSVDKQIAGSPFTYKMRYEIYPTFVRATMVQADNSYWFLYEGTPGGSVDSNDSVVRSDGTVTDINTTWDDNDGLGNGADAAGSDGESWAYFRDSGVGKYMYFVQNSTDTLKDSYYKLDDGGGAMTVFGFGRDNSVSDPNRELITSPESFTFGIADGGGSFSDAKTQIDGTYKAESVSQATAQVKPA